MSRRLSFRDPGGRVLLIDNRIFRTVGPDGMQNLEAFLQSPTVQTWVAAGRAVTTRTVSEHERERAGLPPTGAGTVVEHDANPFVSYPVEWSAQMLHAAASATLQLATALLEEGLGLKDASPYNVLFRGPSPVFVDALSVERRVPGDHVWRPRAQFERAFLLPLLAQRHLGLPIRQVFAASRDGLEPEQVYAMLPLARRVLPPWLPLVSLPVWLQARASQQRTYRARTVAPEQARFVLAHQFGRLQRALRRTAPRDGEGRSSWSSYADENSYSSSGQAAKEAFVDRVMRDRAPRAVLDVGANTGAYSLAAARRGARVVAIDRDAVVMGRLWTEADREGLDVLPLIVDIAQPTPSAGWRNAETLSFLERAAEAFDAVFLLAVVHHLLVTARVPLEEIFEIAATMTTRWAVVEYVGKEDAMFQAICRGREGLFAWYTPDAFERALAPHFHIVERAPIEGARVGYLLEKRDRT